MRLVLDTNILTRVVISPQGLAAELFDAARRRASHKRGGNGGRVGISLAAGSGSGGYPVGASAESLSAGVPEPGAAVLFMLSITTFFVIPRRKLDADCGRNRCFTE
jgi:hypothetical protein